MPGAPGVLRPDLRRGGRTEGGTSRAIACFIYTLYTRVRVHACIQCHIVRYGDRRPLGAVQYGAAARERERERERERVREREEGERKRERERERERN